MKTQRPRFAVFLLMASVFFVSCKEETPIPPCKVSVIDRGNGNKHTYTYDANGKIIQMARAFDGTGAGKISTYVYSFTYDASGLLIKSSIKLDGKDYGTETYTYYYSQISKVTYVNADGNKGTNNIKYNTAGQIIEFTYETGDPDSDGKQYFEYDANNIMTKRGFADLQGNKYFEVIIKPVGIVKSPEQLLVNNGLPFDVLSGFSWQVAEGNVGTTYESFFADQDGKSVSDGKEKITAVKTNTKGYLIENTSVDDNNKSNYQQITLTDCN
ncbi:MAG: hypothetical protein U0X91_13250 [Spirosomataceae bacterium]